MLCKKEVLAKTTGKRRKTLNEWLTAPPTPLPTYLSKRVRGERKKKTVNPNAKAHLTSPFHFAFFLDVLCMKQRWEKEGRFVFLEASSLCFIFYGEESKRRRRELCNPGWRGTKKRRRFFRIWDTRVIRLGLAFNQGAVVVWLFSWFNSGIFGKIVPDRH